MARYSVGIDLGTTHCALSYFNLEEGKPRGASQPVLPVPQLSAPGVTESRVLLPSFLYLPSPEEFPPDALRLPWGKEDRQVVGEFARSHGAKVPTRLISSAKSWLCHPGVDRKRPLLPWNAPAEVPRLSPQEVSTRYLLHLRQAWDHQFATGKAGKTHALAAQDVVVTVPASFDAAARELTIEAAQKAGLSQLILLEEPQAALYAWLEAIGDNILLGGDNMDLTLAHALNQRLAGEGKKLDAWQFNALAQACRQAKEQLFSDPSLKKVPVAIAGRGSSLIGGTLKAELRREDVTQLLTDGFFPEGPISELPQAARRSGLAQIDLPYAQDPAITRHLASFLTRQARALENTASFLHPTAVLFNGGVFKAAVLKDRVLNLLNQWLQKDGGKPAKELAAVDLDLAVARGAAYYGWVRQGHGLRIRGGTARSYYVGVEAAMPAVPGYAPPVRALCVAPFGMEEGTQADIPPQEFGLVVGEPTRFRFFASSVRRQDKVGQWIEDGEHTDEFEELAPIETTLPGQPQPAAGLTPVHLQAAVTELGLLELRCLEKDGPRRWKLELNVREKERASSALILAPPTARSPGSMPARGRVRRSSTFRFLSWCAPAR